MVLGAITGLMGLASQSKQRDINQKLEEERQLSMFLARDEDTGVSFITIIFIVVAIVEIIFIIKNR